MSFAWVSLSFATFGLIVENGVVVDAPPIARWAIGKEEGKVLGYYRRRREVIRVVGSDEWGTNGYGETAGGG